MIAARPTVRNFVTGVGDKLGYKQSRPDLKPKSVEQILLAVDMLELWAGQEVFVDQLSRDYLLAFRAWRLEEREMPVCSKHCYKMTLVRGTQYRCPQRDCPERARHAVKAANATANKNIRTLVALWYEAIDQGFNDQPKMRLKPLKEDLDNLPAWQPNDLAAILASCRQEPQELFLPCSTSAFWFALILVIYDTGSRISAIMDATPADMDWSTGMLTLTARNTKGRKCQVFAISDQTVEALKEVYDESRAWIFPWPYGRARREWNSLRTRYKRILMRAGLPTTKIHLFHKLRRTTATQLTIASNLTAAQEHLGHSSPAVTKRYIDQRQLPKTRFNTQLLPRPNVAP